MNLEAMGSNLDEVVHEAQLMKNYNHPNILPLHTSFVNDADLWMVCAHPYTAPSTKE